MDIRCPHCQARLQVADEKAYSDRRIACGACLRPFAVADALVGAIPAAPAARQVAQPESPPAAAEADRSRPSSASRADVRLCAHHPRTPAEHVCPACAQGFCSACVDLVRTAAICRGCRGLCLDASKHTAQEEHQDRVSLPMKAEVRAILAYPLTDKLTFVLMVLVVWVFSLAQHAGGGGAAVLFSQGLLMAYAFNALARASNGNFRELMPEISGVGDLAQPLWASFAAFLSAAWPLIIAAVLGWSSPLGLFDARAHPDDSPALVSVAHAEDEDLPAPYYDEHGAEDDAGDPAAGDLDLFAPVTDTDEVDRPEPAPPPAPLRAGFWLMIVGIVWYIVYTPVALIVAVISRGAGPLSCLFQTLNPLVGISTILRMGSTYWQALGLYLAFAIPPLLLGLLFVHIPVAGGLLAAFVDGYAKLAIGFALGLAVFKTSAELELS